jgi:uncharacterized membrane protein YgdD (TMEM256/DUF423 family)
MTERTAADWFFLIGSICAGTAVAAGAFGAHLLKGLLEESMLTVFETAARYQMYHALALCIVSWPIVHNPRCGFTTAGWLFVTGILLFCGSLYGLALTSVRWLGAVTPIGGTALLAGWGVLAWRTWRTMRNEGARG